jgi:hypothetical protein
MAARLRVVTFITDGNMKVTTPDGESKILKTAAGEVNTDQPFPRQRRDDAVNACVVGQVQLVKFYPQWLSAERKQAHSKASRAAMLQRRRTTNMDKFNIIVIALLSKDGRIHA